jgi:DNA-directed RNA polymerase subunit K/omega
MTYIPVHRILEHIPNKFEAIKVAALECRRLNDKFQALEISEERKIASLAVERLIDGKITYFDARERREQERSEAMLAAAEEMLDMTAPSPQALAELEESEELSGEAQEGADAAPGPSEEEGEPAAKAAAAQMSADASDSNAGEPQEAASEETKD